MSATSQEPDNDAYRYLRRLGFPRYVNFTMPVFTDAEPFEGLPQREQFKALVESAVMKIWGSSWTTDECRSKIAAAALAEWDMYDAALNAAADAQMQDGAE